MEEDYLNLSSEDYTLAGQESMAAAFAKSFGAFSTYQSFKNQAAQYKAEAVNAQTQATEIRAQASERVAFLRKQFTTNVNSAMQGAANRNISVTSGAVVGQIGAGSRDLGKDIATIEKNAESKAKQLENQSKYYKTASAATSSNAIYGALGDISGAVQSGIRSYNYFSKA